MENDERWQRLTDLLRPFHARAVATARRLAGSRDEGDDLFQDVLLRAHRGLDRVREEDRFEPWFYAILLNLHRSRARRSFWRRFLPLPEPGAAGPLEPALPPADDAIQRSLRLARALDTLPAVQKEAIVMCDLEGYPLELVARVQGVSTTAVKSRLSRGRHRLRRHYERRRRIEATEPAMRAVAWQRGD